MKSTPDPGSIPFSDIYGYTGHGLDLPKILKFKRSNTDEVLGMVFYETMLQSVDLGSVCEKQGFNEVVGLAICEIDFIPVNSLADITKQIQGKLQAEITFGRPYKLYMQANSGMYIGRMILNGVDPDSKAFRCGAVAHLGCLVSTIDGVPVEEMTLMKSTAGKDSYVVGLTPPPRAEHSKTAVIRATAFQSLVVESVNNKLILRGPRTLELAPFIGSAIWTVNGKEVNSWNPAVLLALCKGIAAIAITFYSATNTDLHTPVEGTVDVFLNRSSPKESYGIVVTSDGILQSLTTPADGNSQLKPFINRQVYGCNNRLIHTVTDLMEEIKGKTNIKLQFHPPDSPDNRDRPVVEINSSDTHSTSAASASTAEDSNELQKEPKPWAPLLPKTEPPQRATSLSPSRVVSRPAPSWTLPIPARPLTVSPSTSNDYEAVKSQYWQQRIRSLSQHRIIATYRHADPFDEGTVSSPPALRQNRNFGTGKRQSRRVTITASSSPDRDGEWSGGVGVSPSSNNRLNNTYKRRSQKIVVRAMSPSLARSSANDDFKLNQTYSGGVNVEPRNIQAVTHLGGRGQPIAGKNRNSRPVLDLEHVTC